MAIYQNTPTDLQYVEMRWCQDLHVTSTDVQL